MNAQQVQLADGTKLEAYRCGICGLIYSEHKPYSSELCCKCQDCGAVNEPKKGCGRAHLYAKLDAERLERAVELKGYDGPVVSGDHYYGTLADYLDQKDGEETPEFVHTCRVIPYSLDADYILQNLLENANVEDRGEDDLAGVREFRAAVTAFNCANEKNVYWEEDGKHKVSTRVPEKS